MSNLVAVWNVPLFDFNHEIEFEHGRTSGKRLIRLNKKNIFKKDWMFKLTGSGMFEIGVQKIKCEILILNNSTFSYEYKLLVNGDFLDTFKQNQRKKIKVWYYLNTKNNFRIVLDKENLDVWINGNKQNIENNFTENGTEIKFSLIGNNLKCVIKISSSGNKNEGLFYDLFIANQIINEVFE